VWFEWRTLGWVLPTLTVAMLALYFVVVPLFAAAFLSSTDTRTPLGEGFGERFVLHWGKNQHIVSTGMLTVALGAGVLTGAYLFLRSGEWREGSTFMRTRPMNKDGLAQARLTVLIFSTATATAIMLGMFGVVDVLIRSTDPNFDSLFYLRLGFDHIPDPFILAFFGGTLFIIMWVGLWIVNLSIGIGLYGTLLLLGALFSMVLGDPWKSFLGQASVNLTALIAIGVSVWLTRNAWQERILSRRVGVLAGGLWTLYTLPFLVYGLGIRYYANIPDGNGGTLWNVRVTDLNLVPDSAIPFTHPVDWVLWTALSILPILPLVTLPYRLNRMRHE
jgi:hypothetical protein